MDSANTTVGLTTAAIQIVQMDITRWILYLVAALIGGLASSLVNNKGAIKRMGWDDPDPQKRKQLEMGLIADLASGVAAALGILWMMTPQTFFQLIGIGAVAGYGGSAILQALVNRLAADVSKTEKEKVENEKKSLEDAKKQLDEKTTKIAQAEKDLDKKKAEISIIEKIAEVKKKLGSGG